MAGKKTPSPVSNKTPQTVKAAPPKRRRVSRTSGRGVRTPASRRKAKAKRPVLKDEGTRQELEDLTKPLSWRREVPISKPIQARVSLRNLHILMVGWEWPPHHSGGLGVHSYELCRELTRMGHRITFLTPFQGPFTPVPGVTFRFPGDAPAHDRWYPPAYWSGEAPGSPFRDAMDGYNAWVAELKELPPVDVVHVHDWFGTVGAIEIARRLKRPLVMTVHSTEYDRSLGHPWDHILYREKLGITRADRVIAVSRHLRQQLIERYRATPGKVRVIYNAVRPSDRLAPLEDSRNVVLYLGRLAAMKGVDTFLRAAARVAETAPDTLFVVAGEGPEFPRLLNLAAHLGIDDQVLFLGKVTDEERVVLMASASVFVLPSVVEPFGIAALEAMAAGVPAIVSKTSGVAEITESVFVVDFWDSEEFASRISELLHYPVLRREMGEHGRWEALREGWPERALQTVGVYAEVLLNH